MKLIPYLTDKDYSVYLRIVQVMKKIQKEGDFGGTERRLAMSTPTFLITDNNEDIGFLYFVEENYGSLLAVDIGIISHYRHRNIAYTALSCVIEKLKKYTGIYLVAQVLPDNVASLALMKKLGAVQVSAEYYLLNPDQKLAFESELRQGKIRLENESIRQRVLKDYKQE